MSSDSHSEKNIENTTKSDSAESNLDNPDAQDAREADKDTITEIGKQNPDNWMSAEGHFAIVDENQVLASRDVTEENSSPAQVDNNQNLSVELQAIKDSGNPEQSQLAEHIQDMRSAAKEKGLGTAEIDKFAKETFTTEGKEEQFERGAFKSLSSEQAKGSEPLSTTDQPVGGYEQENRADGGITLKGVIPGDANNNWQTIVSRVSELPIDKQFEIIGNGLQAFNNELNHQKLEIAVGTIEGIGEGFKSLGDGVVSLANGLGQIGQFSADVMTNNPRAIETGAQAGEAIGKTLVGGVKLFQLSHDYLYNIGFTGDYAKPFNDIANLGEQLDESWQKMPTRERAKLTSKLSTEFLAGLAVPFSAAKLAKSERITQTFEELASKAKDLGKGAKDKTSKFIGELVDDLIQPSAITPDGQRIRVPREPQRAEVLHMSKPDAPHPKTSRKHIEENQLIENADLVPLSEGFYAELGKAYDSLSPKQKQFLKIKGVKVKPVKRMSDVPGASTNFGGGYRANEIYLPEEILQNGNWIRNDDLAFRLRHEIGHAFNEASGELSGIPMSDKSAFRKAFNEDLKRASKENLRQLQLAQNPTEARDEIFADLYGHITSPKSSNARYSQLIKSVFKNCFEHLSKEIKHQ